LRLVIQAGTVHFLHHVEVARACSKRLFSASGCSRVNPTWQNASSSFAERRRIDAQRLAVHALLDGVGVGLRIPS
jgi:hypothetical protein